MNTSKSFGWMLRMNMTLLASIIGALLVGVAFVYSACSIREADALRRLYLLHAQMGVIGLLICFGLAYMNYQDILRGRWLFYVGTLALLALTLLIGDKTMGARRWVAGIQPSELAKLATILVLAEWLGRRDASKGIGMYLGALALTAVPMALILMQPDLGTTLVFLPTVFAMLFVARVSPRAVLATICAAVLVLVLVLGLIVASESEDVSAPTRARIQKMLPLSAYQRDRLVVFLYPDHDPFGRGWNKRQSEIAVGSGGLWGKGYLKGDQNLLGYLPASVASNDFIFSVLAEETGFVGSLIVLLLAVGILLPTLAVAYVCQDGAGRLLCVGVATVTFCHLFVNIGMTIGLLPVTGVPLPFISSGRTFLLTMMTAYGLVQSVAVHGRETAPRF